MKEVSAATVDNVQAGAIAGTAIVAAGIASARADAKTGHRNSAASSARREAIVRRANLAPTGLPPVSAAMAARTARGRAATWTSSAATSRGALPANRVSPGKRGNRGSRAVINSRASRVLRCRQARKENAVDVVIAGAVAIAVRAKACPQNRGSTRPLRAIRNPGFRRWSSSPLSLR